MSNNVLQKITPKTVGWDKADIAVALRAKERVFIGRFYGKLTGLKPIVDNNTGEVSYGLKGEFQCDNYRGISDSGVMFLPSGIQAMLESPVKAALDAGEKAPAIDFLIDVYAVRANNAIGYSFEGESHLAKTSDPFAGMKAAAPALVAATVDKPVALAAPTAPAPEAPALNAPEAAPAPETPKK